MPPFVLPHAFQVTPARVVAVDAVATLVAPEVAILGAAMTTLTLRHTSPHLKTITYGRWDSNPQTTHSEYVRYAKFPSLPRALDPELLQERSQLRLSADITEFALKPGLEPFRVQLDDGRLHRLVRREGLEPSNHRFSTGEVYQIPITPSRVPLLFPGSSGALEHDRRALGLPQRALPMSARSYGQKTTF